MIAPLPDASGNHNRGLTEENDMKKENVTVKLSEEQPESTEIIAAAIIKISDGFAKLIKGGLNERAMIVLIKDHTGVAQYEIKKVLECLPRLKELYCSNPRR